MGSTTTGKRFLVVGANGNSGSSVSTLLLERGESVRCMVRSEEKGSALKEAGAEVVVADLDRPATLADAFQGIDTAFLVTSVNPNADVQAINGINAAKNAGVKHLVRYSGAMKFEGLTLQTSEKHFKVDAAVAESGIPFTIVRPHTYMQNLFIAAATVASDSAIYLPFGEGKVGMVDLRDVAEAVAAITLNGGHSGENYIVTGPESISIADAAKAISGAIGKDVSYVNITSEDAREGMLSMGFDPWAVDEFVGYYKGFSQNQADLVTDDFKRITGREPRSISDFANDFASVFGAEVPQTAR